MALNKLVKQRLLGLTANISKRFTDSYLPAAFSIAESRTD